MKNEVARVVYTPTTAIAKEQLEQIRHDGNSTPSVVFDASNNPGANVQFSGRIDLTKEKQEILIKTIEEKIHNLEKHFNDVQSRQGWIGKSWNWIKNVTGLGAGSDKAQKAIDELKSKIEIAKAHPEKVEEIFREITGQELTLGNLQKLETGELGLKGQERVTKYEQGQGMAKGIFSTIATIGAVTGIMALGIVGTPFTGGMSLGASLAASAAILGTGAAVSVAVNASDAMTSEAKDYSFKQAGKDAISGSVDGALTVATMGLGNAISVGAKTAANSARFAKFGQVLVKPAVQNTVIGASTGVVFGGGGSATEYLLNADEYAFSDFLSATGKGAMNGAVFGGVAGGVGSKFAVLNDKVASKTASMNSRFLAKTLNGTTKGLTTAATGFIGGGVSSEVGYLMDADEVTADGMLDAFTEGGQGGAAMMLGFEGVNGAIMSTPRAKKVLRQKQINSLLEMWGVKPENQAERLAYEKMAESFIKANETKSKETTPKFAEEFKGNFEITKKMQKGNKPSKTKSSIQKTETNSPTMKIQKANALADLPKIKGTNIGELYKNPEFKAIVEKIRAVKSTENQRAQDITNILLEYMGYPADTIKTRLVDKNIETGGEYFWAKWSIEINKFLLNSSNEEIGTVIFHELTHMDNTCKIVKKIGLEKFYKYKSKEIIEALNDPLRRQQVLSEIRTEVQDFNFPPTEKNLMDLMSKLKLKEIKKASKYTSIADSDSKYIEKLVNELKNNSYKSAANDVEDFYTYATDNYQYYHSPDEARAYEMGRQINKAIGVNYTEYAELLLLTQKARDLFEEHSLKKYGIRDIAKLSEGQITEVNRELNTDLQNFIKIREIMEGRMCKGKLQIISREQFDEIFYSGCSDVEDYLCYILKNGNLFE